MQHISVALANVAASLERMRAEAKRQRESDNTVIKLPVACRCSESAACGLCPVAAVWGR